MGFSSNAKVASLSSLPRRQIMITLAGVMLAMFLSSLDQTVVGTAMPRIIADLGGFNQYTWVTTAYIITSAVTVPIVGKLTDMYGRKPFYIAGLFIFIFASLACGLSHTMNQIIAFRAIQGIGAGIMMANAFTVIGDLFAPAERGKYQGYMAGVFGLSSVIGPTLGGYLTDSFSWHWVFFVNVPLGLVVILLFFRYFPHLRPDNLSHSLDFAGVALLILTVVPFMLGLTWGGTEYPWRSPEIISLFIVAAVSLLIFLFLESRAKEPIIPLSLFKNPIISISQLVIFLTGIGMFGAIIFIPLYFQGILGASAAQSGNFLIPMMMGVILGSAVSGQILSRAGGHYRIQGILGTAVMAVGIFLLSRMTVDTTFATVVIYTIITGLGLGTTFPVFTIAVQNAVPHSQLGVATSATAFFRSIGGSVGLAVLGSVMNNRFASDLVASVPAQLKTVLPPDQLASLANNPQLLVNPAAQTQLKAQLTQLAGPGAYDQLLGGTRQALSSAMSEAFLIGGCIIVAALAVTFFLKEIPLRRHNLAPVAELEGKVQPEAEKTIQ
jgi:EmrB/QacA subfamily drug resistance transporter